MTYNKVKHGFDKAGGIVAIVLGSLICFDVLISFISMVNSCVSMSKLGVTFGEYVIFIFIGLVLRLVFGAVNLFFGTKTIGKPYLYKNKSTNVSFYIYSSNGQNITLIVFGFLLFIGGLCINEIGYNSNNILIEITQLFQIFQNILALSVAVLKIVAISLKGEIFTANSGQCAQPTQILTSNTQQNAQKNIQKIEKKEGLESKIAELKRLKELCVLTEEEYKTALSRLIEKEI